jgi:hypothetical protein
MMPGIVRRRARREKEKIMKKSVKYGEPVIKMLPAASAG